MALRGRFSAARARLEKQGPGGGGQRRLDATQAARVREMKAAGRSTRKISEALKIPRSTVRGALARAE
jgi:DNA invertase Pin-like site-specific DNA recombinase